MKETFYENDDLTRILEELKGYQVSRVDEILSHEDKENVIPGTEIKFMKIAANGYIVKKIQIFEDGRVYESPARVKEINE